MVKAKKENLDQKWAEASTYAQEKFSTTMTDLIKKRDAGDRDAQDKINEAYGFGAPDMTAEGQRHLRKQAAEATAGAPDVIGDYNLRVKERKDAAFKAASDMLSKTNEAVIDVMDTGRLAQAGLEEMGGKKKRRSKKNSGIAGE